MRRRGLNLRKGMLRCLFPFLRRLPPKVASRSLSGIGRFEYRSLAGVRLRFNQAIEYGNAQLNQHWNVQESARELAGYHIRWRTRDLLLDGLSNAKVASMFEIVGREHLDDTLKQGRGVVLLGNHFGSNLMPAHWLHRENYPLRLFMERPRHVSKFLVKKFDEDGPLGQKKLFISRKADANEAAASIMKAAKILKAGMVVKMACDVRWSGAHTAEVDFLGKPYSFSTTWITLAAITKAPVVQVFCWMLPDGSYRMEFLPPFEIPSDAVSSGSAGSWTRLALASIIERIQIDPANSNDYFFWGLEEEIGQISSSSEVARRTPKA